VEEIFFYDSVNEIIDGYMKDVYIFFFPNTENPVVLILFTMKVNLSALELFERMANSKSASSTEMVLFFLLFTDSNLKPSGAQKLVHI